MARPAAGGRIYAGTEACLGELQPGHRAAAHPTQPRGRTEVRGHPIHRVAGCGCPRRLRLPVGTVRRQRRAAAHVAAARVQSSTAAGAASAVPAKPGTAATVPAAAAARTARAAAGHLRILCAARAAARRCSAGYCTTRCTTRRRWADAAAVRLRPRFAGCPEPPRSAAAASAWAGLRVLCANGAGWLNGTAAR